jgi:hypothetical protein
LKEKAEWILILKKIIEIYLCVLGGLAVKSNNHWNIDNTLSI